MDYADYFFQFYEFLTRQTLHEAPYYITAVEQITIESPLDFTITHVKEVDSIPEKTNVYLIGEMKRKNKNYPETSVSNNIFDIVIRISEFTSEQLSNFVVSGEGKFQLEWEYCIDKASDLYGIDYVGLDFFERKRDEILDAVSKHMEKKRLREKQTSDFMTNGIHVARSKLAPGFAPFTGNFKIEFDQQYGFHRLFPLLSPSRITHNRRARNELYLSEGLVVRRGRELTIDEVRDIEKVLWRDTFTLHFDEFKLEMTKKKSDGKIWCEFNISTTFRGPRYEEIAIKILSEIWRSGETSEAIEQLEVCLREERQLMQIMDEASNENPLSIIIADSTRPKYFDAMEATSRAVGRVLMDLNHHNMTYEISSRKLIEVWQSFDNNH
jgi:hypothetical protein